MKFFGIFVLSNGTPVIQRYYFPIQRKEKFKTSKQLYNIICNFAQIDKTSLNNKDDQILFIPNEEFNSNFNNNDNIIPEIFVSSHIPEWEGTIIVFKVIQTFIVAFAINENTISPLVVLDSLAVYLQCFIMLVNKLGKENYNTTNTKYRNKSIDLKENFILLESLTDEMYAGGLIHNITHADIIKGVSSKYNNIQLNDSLIGAVKQMKEEFIKALTN